ncbi:hypothetical protein MRX96_041034 [Rhipicephalus microplus]
MGAALRHMRRKTRWIYYRPRVVTSRLIAVQPGVILKDPQMRCRICDAAFSPPPPCRAFIYTYGKANRRVARLALALLGNRLEKARSQMKRSNGQRARDRKKRGSEC